MLDFSQTKNRRSIYLPAGVKLIFLLIPWAFVAYGLSLLPEFVSFYNNSEPAAARVVFEKPSNRPITRESAQSKLDNVGEWPLPGFLYKHENGEFYVGAAIAPSKSWRYHHGELLDIRFNRVSPDQAQPVTILRFWWTPGIFIVGGFIAFVALLIAFEVAENSGKIWLFGSKRKKRSLNLRRK